MLCKYFVRDCTPAYSHLAILVFIVLLQRIPCSSECIDNLAIVLDVLATPRAIAGIAPLAPATRWKSLR